MKPILAMAVNNTDENERYKYTHETITSLLENGIQFKSKIHIIVNGSCAKTLDFVKKLPIVIKVIINNENIGTARAINKAWLLKEPNQHCIKMDDDCVIKSSTWIEEMIEAIERQPKIGIVGLKRKDCTEYPGNPNPDLNSELLMLPHKMGQKWIIAEKQPHILGTCQMYNYKLLEMMGYLYQPGIYGYDDVIASHKSHIAGFINVMLPHIEIDHIDTGATPYQHWKEKTAGEVTQQVITEVNEMLQGIRPIYQSYY